MFRISAIATAVLLLSAIGQFSHCQDKPAKDVGKAVQNATQETPADLESRMIAAMSPGKVHEQFEKLAGKWKVKSTLEMSGSVAEESAGESEMKMIIGGRFLEEIGTGTMLGSPYEHRRIWGYNNSTKKYQALWIYTMSTGFLTMEGHSDDGGKTVHWQGGFDNEAGIREEMTAKTTFSDDDHFIVQLIGAKMPDGSAGPVMTAEYERAK